MNSKNPTSVVPPEWEDPPEWKDPREVPWKRWAIGLSLAVLVVMLVMAVVPRVFAPPPPPPLSPAANLTRDLIKSVEEIRGAESLYVMLESAADRRALQEKLKIQRSRLVVLVSKLKAGAIEPAERKHVVELGENMTAWWAVQDEVFEALQPKVFTRDDASRARVLVSVESKRSYDQLLNLIEHWVALQER